MKILVCQTSLSSQYIVDACEIINKKIKILNLDLFLEQEKEKVKKKKIIY